MNILGFVVEPERVGGYFLDQMVKQGWLQCDSVARGMFSDELAVVVTRSNGDKDSYFVPSNDVDAAQRRVRVRVQEAGSLVWVTLPTPDHVTIPVARSGVVMT
jgi:hypothetical protein